MNNYQKIFFLVLLFVIGCSSAGGSSNNNGPAAMPANPCATPGGSYLEQITILSGNCPVPTAQVVNITTDGKVIVPSLVSCSELSVNGCITHQTNCSMKSSSDGVTCSAVFNGQSTFSDDGSGMSGTMTMSIDCSDGSYCNGTFGVTATRQ